MSAPQRYWLVLSGVRPEERETAMAALSAFCGHAAQVIPNVGLMVDYESPFEAAAALAAIHAAEGALGRQLTTAAVKETLATIIRRHL